MNTNPVACSLSTATLESSDRPYCPKRLHHRLSTDVYSHSSVHLHVGRWMGILAVGGTANIRCQRWAEHELVSTPYSAYSVLMQPLPVTTSLPKNTVAQSAHPMHDDLNVGQDHDSICTSPLYRQNTNHMQMCTLQRLSHYGC